MTTALALEAAEILQLQDVTLSDHRVTLGKGFDVMRSYDGTTINVTYGPRESRLQSLTLDGGENVRRWVAIFGARIRLINGVRQTVDLESLLDDDLLADIDVAFQVLTFVRPDSDPNPKALEAFAQQNLKHLVWPYLREWLQHVCARTRLPMATLDLQIPSKSQARGERSNEAHHELDEPKRTD